MTAKSCASVGIFSLKNRLELVLRSVPHALWGAAPILLVLISVTISSYTLPALFQRNSQKDRTCMEPSQERALCEARSADRAKGSSPPGSYGRINITDQVPGQRDGLNVL